MMDSCPKCKGGKLMELPSMNKKMCIQCKSYFTWALKDGQKSVTIDNYIGGRDDALDVISKKGRK